MTSEVPLQRPTRPNASPRRWLLPCLLLLLAVAYRELLGWRPTPRMQEVVGAQRWFFIVSETPPYLIYGVAIWMLAARRQRIAAAFAAGAIAPVAAATFLAPSLLLYAWGVHVGAPDLQVPSLSLMLLGLGALLGGRAGLRELRLPALFLVFAIPLPAVLINLIVFPLQLATADLATAMLRALSIPVVHVGDIIFAHDHAFLVIETCSGLRAIETLLMASVLYVDVFYRNRLSSLVLILSAPAIAFLLNGARVVSMVLNPYSDAATVHTVQGVVALVAGVLALAALDRGLARLPVTRVPESRLAPTPHASAGPNKRGLGVAAAWLGLLVGVSLWLPRWPVPELRRVQVAGALPVQLGPWQSERAPSDADFQGSVGHDGVGKRIYLESADPGNRSTGITFFAATHDRVDRRSSLLSAKTAYPGSGAELKRRWPLRIDAQLAGEALSFQTATDPGRFVLAYHWHEGVASPLVEVLRAFFALDRSFLRRPEPVWVWRVSTPVGRSDGDLETAGRRLEAFVTMLREAGTFDALRSLAAPPGDEPTK